jgi:hypothetical protein
MILINIYPLQNTYGNKWKQIGHIKNAIFAAVRRPTRLVVDFLSIKKSVPTL